MYALRSFLSGAPVKNSRLVTTEHPVWVGVGGVVGTCVRYTVLCLTCLSTFPGLSLHNSPGGVEVTVENTPCSDQSYSRREMLSAVCSTPVHGSRVTIRLPGPNRTASLCEVEVYGNYYQRCCII